MDRQILLVHDLVESGKVALGAMVPILSYMGYALHTLPTSLVSNPSCYGCNVTMDTTEHLQRTLDAWDTLGLEFDAVITGNLHSLEQIRVMRGFCGRLMREDACVLVDPILKDPWGPDGLIDELRLEGMRSLVPRSSIIRPNYQEACLLTGTPAQESPLSEGDARTLVERLHALGAQSVVITGCKVEGRDCVIGHDYELDDFFELPFDRIGVSFPGTGDAFSAVLLGHLLQEETLESAAQAALDAVREMVRLSRSQFDPCQGLLIESLLDVVDG